MTHFVPNASMWCSIQTQRQKDFMLAGLGFTHLVLAGIAKPSSSIVSDGLFNGFKEAMPCTPKCVLIVVLRLLMKADVLRVTRAVGARAEFN